MTWRFHEGKQLATRSKYSKFAFIDSMKLETKSHPKARSKFHVRQAALSSLVSRWPSTSHQRRISGLESWNIASRAIGYPFPSVSLASLASPQWNTCASQSDENRVFLQQGLIIHDLRISMNFHGFPFISLLEVGRTWRRLQEHRTQIGSWHHATLVISPFYRCSELSFGHSKRSSDPWGMLWYAPCTCAFGPRRVSFMPLRALSRSVIGPSCLAVTLSSSGALIEAFMWYILAMCAMCAMYHVPCTMCHVPVFYHAALVQSETLPWKEAEKKKKLPHPAVQMQNRERLKDTWSSYIV